MIRLAILLSLPGFLASCSEQQTAIDGTHLRDEVISFERLQRTVQVFFKIDSSYHAIGPTIYMWGPDDYAAYSNGVDTIHVCFYDIPKHQNVAFNKLEYKKNIEAKARSLGNRIQNLNISPENGLIRASFYETGRSVSEVNYDILKPEDRVNIRFVYQAWEIDAYRYAAFNQLCRSVSLKIY